jgi:hypothetical protein
MLFSRYDGTEPLSCYQCEEDILPGEFVERIPLINATHVVSTHVHYECGIRSVIGSVAHQKGKCICFGGEVHDEEHEKGMSKREAARAAANHFWETKQILEKSIDKVMKEKK